MLKRSLFLTLMAAAVVILPVGASLAQDATTAASKTQRVIPRQPVPGPWIAEMGEMGTTYGFASFLQCQNSVSGIGGFCYQQ